MPYVLLLVSKGAAKDLHPSSGADGPQGALPPQDSTGIRTHCAPAHDLSSAANLADAIMMSADDEFIIGGYSRVCHLLKVAKEQLAEATWAAHRRQDDLRLAGHAAAA